MSDFELSGVVHLVRPTHLRARTLEELRKGLAAAEPETLFFHAVQYRLRHAAIEDLPPDDLVSWAYGVLQDRETAERLSFASQNYGQSFPALRQALLETLDAIPIETRESRGAPEGGEFVFLTVDSVPVPTGVAAATPSELPEALADADPSVWFYHLVEEPWFSGAPARLLEWMRDAGAARDADALERDAAAGASLDTLRRRALGRWRRARMRRRVGEGAHLPEDRRRETERAAVAGLVRRLSRTDGTP
jgi:hypothetical protein